MAIAASLIFVLPEPENDGYALNAAQESTIRIGPETGPGAQRFSGSETVDESDELALASGAGASPRYADAASEAPAAAVLQAASRLSTTTEPPSSPVTAEASTTTAAVTTTTTAATDQAAVDAMDEQSTTTATAEATVTSETEATVETAAEGQVEDGADETAPASSSDGETETTDPADTAPETTQPPETTEPPATTPPETAPPETSPPADPAYVDTGNGVLVPPVLLAIRFCESTDNYAAANPNSSARGGYQFLTGSWAAYGHKDRYGVNQAHLASPAQQDEAALLTWERDGTRPWNASKSCWSKRI